MSEAEGYRRRAEVIDRHYYKELAHLSLGEVSDPRALFSCLTERDEASVSMLTSHISGICREGVTGAMFAEACADICRANGVLPSLGEMLPHAEDSEPTTAALVTGGYADNAFASFREEYSRIRHTLLRPHHADRIQSACDCVLDGEADFAVIPVWNDRDGRLRSFYAMIDSFDLKILSVTNVPTGDGRTRFALCGSDAGPLYASPEYMEFSVPDREGIAADVADAVRAHGHLPVDMSSSPNGRGESRLNMTVKASGDIRPALLYLNLFHPDYNITGIYGCTG